MFRIGPKIRVMRETGNMGIFLFWLMREPFLMPRQ